MRLILINLIVVLGTSLNVISQDLVNGRGIELHPHELILYSSNDQFDATGTYKFGDSEWESSLYILKS